MQGLKVIHVFETVLNLFNECDKLKSELEEKKASSVEGKDLIFSSQGQEVELPSSVVYMTALYARHVDCAIGCD